MLPREHTQECVQRRWIQQKGDIWYLDRWTDVTSSFCSMNTTWWAAIAVVSSDGTSGVKRNKQVNERSIRQRNFGRLLWTCLCVHVTSNTTQQTHSKQDTGGSRWGKAGSWLVETPGSERKQDTGEDTASSEARSRKRVHPDLGKTAGLTLFQGFRWAEMKL